MVLKNTDMLSLTSGTGANGMRSAREADHERRSVDMCNEWQMSFSVVNPKGKCWIRLMSSGDSKVMCWVFRLRNRFAASVSAHSFH